MVRAARLQQSPHPAHWSWIKCVYLLESHVPTNRAGTFQTRSEVTIPQTVSQAAQPFLPTLPSNPPQHPFPPHPLLSPHSDSQPQPAPIISQPTLALPVELESGDEEALKSVDPLPQYATKSQYVTPSKREPSGKRMNSSANPSSTNPQGDIANMYGCGGAPDTQASQQIDEAELHGAESGGKEP